MLYIPWVEFQFVSITSNYPLKKMADLISNCLISTRNMVISSCRSPGAHNGLWAPASCHLKTTNGLKNLPEAVSEGLKFKKFQGVGGACSQTSLEDVLPHAVPPFLFL